MKTPGSNQIALVYRLPVLLASLAMSPAKSHNSSALPVVMANDNRKPAGHLENGVLTIRLVIGMARWYPEAADGPSVAVPAISEEGGPPVIPAPLIRVPTGTIVEATVRNTLTDSTIYLRGLSTRPAKALDSIPVAPGQQRTIRFAAGVPGSYVYLATPGILDYAKYGERETSGGAFIVDEPGKAPDDRIFVINIWGEPIDSLTYSNALAINGKSWPYTERISATVGDTLRWRVINASVRNHPMHLHGFYFRVDARGNGAMDSVYAPDARRLGVTEDMSALNTMDMVWSPNRPGNWLFHCHLAFHVVPGEAQLSGESNSHTLHSGDVRQHMAGLILGINVRPGPTTASTSGENVRKLRLFVDEGRRRSTSERALGFVLQDDDFAPAADSIVIPGSLLVLTRDQPTDITVINRLREPTSVHWHGLELESYSDGVAGWSGIADHLAPVIAPNDSFIAHLTLHRSGTFIYHTHLNDIEQLTSGLYGAIVVVDPGKQFDPGTDHVLIAGWDGHRKGFRMIVNGDSTAAPLVVSAGIPQRFRFINIGPANRLVFSIRRDSTVLTWRGLAKDGADLPPLLAVKGPASRRLGVGEMFDAEFLPLAGEGYHLLAATPGGRKVYDQRLIVR